MVQASSRRALGVVVGLLLGFLLGPAVRVEAQAVPMCIGCTPDYKVEVTPDGSGISRVAGTLGLQETFTVKNVGLYSDTYTLTCSTTGKVTCTNVSPGSVALGSNATQLVTVTYNTSTAGSGVLTLRAQGASDFWDTGSYNVTVTSAPPPPTVTLVLPTLTSGSRAVVARRQPVIDQRRAVVTEMRAVHALAVQRCCRYLGVHRALVTYAVRRDPSPPCERRCTPSLRPSRAGAVPA